MTHIDKVISYMGEAVSSDDDKELGFVIARRNIYSFSLDNYESEQIVRRGLYLRFPQGNEENICYADGISCETVEKVMKEKTRINLMPSCGFSNNKTTYLREDEIKRLVCELESRDNNLAQSSRVAEVFEGLVAEYDLKIHTLVIQNDFHLQCIARSSYLYGWNCQKRLSCLFMYERNSSKQVDSYKKLAVTDSLEALYPTFFNSFLVSANNASAELRLTDAVLLAPEVIGELIFLFLNYLYTRVEADNMRLPDMRLSDALSIIINDERNGSCLGNVDGAGFPIEAATVVEHGRINNTVSKQCLFSFHMEDHRTTLTQKMSKVFVPGTIEEHALINRVNKRPIIIDNLDGLFESIDPISLRFNAYASGAVADDKGCWSRLRPMPISATVIDLLKAIDALTIETEYVLDCSICVGYARLQELRF